MPPRLFQVDSFTDVPFAGNPAGVCLLDEAIDDNWMQRLAQEMNLSETAFVQAERRGYRLRWFTPVAEVDLCGHATLAAAHVLWEERRLERTDPASFETRSGTLTCTWRDGSIEMDFPADRPVVTSAPRGLLESLGVEAVKVARGRAYWLVELESETAVRQLEPDFDALRRLNLQVIVTSEAAGEMFDFISRFFAPSFGIDEDPVTGSAHCVLGPWWAKRLKRDEMVGYQASPRGGIVRVKMADDRAILSGSAITVFRGQLTPQAMPVTQPA